jgi:signal transduction histidine kinase
MPRPDEPVNILMVDDQPARLLSYETVLSDLGENLLKASSGREALEVLLKTDVAVVLVDVVMPEMDGYDLAHLIRQHPRFRDTAIIMVSGIHISDMDRLKGYDSGAVDYVSVPIVPEVLRAKVRVYVDLFRKTRELHLLNRNLEDLVAERTTELRRSNDDLRQFAVIASHDLQEPLRMISSFVQLLAKRYRGKLDANAEEFIRFAVDGTRRMYELIDDLLMYSRLDTAGSVNASVDSQMALQRALENLHVAIAESGAIVEHDSLPIVRADESQLVQLLQNLVGNAIKFRHADRKPRIHVGAEPADRMWCLSVRDNGIGIEPRYFERIFQIFQRLHGREAYQGTGIGLAICKKIVDRHRGGIWVESKPGEGSVFRFTLPGSLEVAKSLHGNGSISDLVLEPQARAPAEAASTAGIAAPPDSPVSSRSP